MWGWGGFLTVHAKSKLRDYSSVVRSHLYVEECGISCQPAKLTSDAVGCSLHFACGALSQGTLSSPGPAGPSLLPWSLTQTPEMAAARESRGPGHRTRSPGQAALLPLHEPFGLGLTSSSLRSLEWLHFLFHTEAGWKKRREGIVLWCSNSDDDSCDSSSSLSLGLLFKMHSNPGIVVFFLLQLRKERHRD